LTGSSETHPAGTIAVVAEKPAVARDIAQVLGATKRGEGYLHGNGWVVTWAIGHLVTLAEPHEIDPAWKRWRLESLPILPESWPLVVIESTCDQFALIKRILTSERVKSVVCATDAGREGELIFRYIYEKAGCTRPVQRLWISSLTADAICEGLAQLRRGSDFDRLADAARGRSRADWLVGMNLSRAYTLVSGSELLSVGRVQTPTLAMLVERELVIRDFVPEDYREVVATFRPLAADGTPDKAATSYEGTYFRDEAVPPSSPPFTRGDDKAVGRQHGPPQDTTAAAASRADEESSDGASPATRLSADGEEAERIAARARTGRAAIASVDARRRTLPPPQLYDLTELQRHANRLFGFTARHTLDVAQHLYEERKLISYPRTDSRYLSKSVASTLPRIVERIAAPYARLLVSDTGTRPPPKRFVDDGKVTDHHAIIPTPTKADLNSLSADECHIYDLICRRLLAAWQPDHVFSVTTVITAVTSPPNGSEPEITDRYRSTGTAVEQMGWKTLDPVPASLRKKVGVDDEQRGQALPSGLRAGMPQEVLDARVFEKRTRPPRRFTEGTLLTAMETAGATLDDRELSDAMRARGLGTPATRAAIIETLVQREYIQREKKALAATDKGIRLIEAVHPDVKSPAMTGDWEAKLQAIERGQGDADAFLRSIEVWVRDVVSRVKGRADGTTRSRLPMNTPLDPPLPRGEEKGGRSAVRKSSRDEKILQSSDAAGPQERASAVPPSDLHEVLHTRFHLDAFRPFQEEVCRTVTAGRDALLVMPTGAGKSLCYQIPGLLRGGTTLIVSPLIALMEDQVAKLCALGLRAERIHSGRSRDQSRAAALAYLDGRLDYLFIAPERLSVPGFPEMLARRPLALTAVDEAHCISHWGHDFRPDYRMLKERLPLLRAAPVIALTATATPQVQKDICDQLGMPGADRFIHGFRRDNLYVEVVEMKPGDRAEAIEALLAQPERRPAIVYAPTRKQTEALAELLAERMPAAAYHAGLPTQRRDEVQDAFLRGKIDVVVATIAFGMGIDKPNIRTVIHAALPGSVEGYYQEIGRGGRDGAPARAILLQSWADRRTHEYFFERDYPDESVLNAVYAVLGAETVPRAALEARLHMDPDTIATAVEKLWIHGGAIVDPEEDVRRGSSTWLAPYREQREHKLEQMELMTRYAQAHECRMLQLVRHFGDQDDDGTPCHQCDICAPGDLVALATRPASRAEHVTMRRILDSLRRQDHQSAGRLHREELAEDVPRREYERLIAALVRAGLIRSYQDNFKRGGETVTFQRLSLCPAGRDLSPLERVVLSDERTGPRKVRTGKRKPRAERSAAPAREAPAELLQRLREWRLVEAHRRSVPAFHIFGDRVLTAIAAARPSTTDDLLAIRGVGPKLTERYGADLIKLLRSG
jgi:DNA topoisomerase III